MSETTIYANSVFEQPWWLETVAPGMWGEVFVKENDEVVARLPYILKKGCITMPPYTQTLGPWIKPEYRSFQPGNTQLSRQKEIVSKLLGQLPAHRSFNMCFDSANDYVLPYKWLDYQYIPTFSYRISNLKDLDQVYSSFNKTVKKNIKYAQNKTHITKEPTPEMLLELVDKTFSAQRRKAPNIELAASIINKTISNDTGKLIIAQDDAGNLHAGAFIVFDEKACYYLIGGSDLKYRSSGAQSLVIWEAIKFASTKSKVFDFEGSNIEGIENFFRQFGGERVVNYRVYKQSLLEDCLMQIKPRVKKFLGYRY